MRFSRFFVSFPLHLITNATSFTPINDNKSDFLLLIFAISQSSDINSACKLVFFTWCEEKPHQLDVHMGQPRFFCRWNPPVWLLSGFHCQDLLQCSIPGLFSDFLLISDFFFFVPRDCSLPRLSCLKKVIAPCQVFAFLSHS